MHEIYARIMLKAQEMNLNGKEIGKLLGLKKSPLTDWKNGQSIPTTEQIIRLCDIFAVSADYLLFGNTNFLSDDENILITNYQKLSDADKQEILNILEYKIYKSKEKEISSHLSQSDNNDLLA